MTDDDAAFLTVLLMAGETLAAQRFILQCFTRARGQS